MIISNFFKKWENCLPGRWENYLPDYWEITLPKHWEKYLTFTTKVKHKERGRIKAVSSASFV